jgi:hypothetical protein
MVEDVGRLSGEGASVGGQGFVESCELRTGELLMEIIISLAGCSTLAPSSKTHFQQSPKAVSHPKILANGLSVTHAHSLPPPSSLIFK